MIKRYETDSERTDDVIKDIIKYLEMETGNKVFTLVPLDVDKAKRGLEVVAVFEDKKALRGFVSIMEEGENLEIRIQGNYV